MKIASISLANFGRHEDLCLELKPVTCITGDNGAGKSTTRRALSVALCGPQKGEDTTHLPRFSARTCSVTLELPDSTRVTRSLPPHELALSWAPGLKVTAAQAALEQLLGCTAEKARLSLGAGVFFGQKAAARGTQLTGLLGLEPERERVAAELEGMTKGGLAVAAAMRKAECKPSDSLGFIQSQTKNYRTTVNRDVKAAQVEATRLHDAWQELDDVTPPTPEELATANQALRAATQALGEHKARGEEIGRLELSAEALRRELAELEKEPKPDIPALQERGKAIDDRLGELRVIRGQVEIRLEAQRTAARELPAARSSCEAMEAALAGEPTCPFRAGHPCDAHREELHAELAELRARVAELEQAAAVDVAAELKTVREKMEKGQAALADVRQQLGAARTRNADRTRQQLEETEATLAELRAKHRTPEELQAAHQEAVAAMQRLQEAHQAHQDYAAAERLAKDAQARLEALTREQEALNALVTWSGPKGLRARILAERLGPFEEELCGVLGLWGMQARHEESKDGPALQVQTPGGAWVPWECLSDSEQLRVDLAHQIAFACLTGLRIVVLDRIEALDATGQAALFDAALLCTRSGWCDHVLLMGVGVWGNVPAEVKCYQLEREAVLA